MLAIAIIFLEFNIFEAIGHHIMPIKTTLIRGIGQIMFLRRYYFLRWEVLATSQFIFAIDQMVSRWKTWRTQWQACLIWVVLDSYLSPQIQIHVSADSITVLLGFLRRWYTSHTTSFLLNHQPSDSLRRKGIGSGLLQALFHWNMRLCTLWLTCTAFLYYHCDDKTTLKTHKHLTLAINCQKSISHYQPFIRHCFRIKHSVRTHSAPIWINCLP